MNRYIQILHPNELVHERETQVSCGCGIVHCSGCGEVWPCSAHRAEIDMAIEEEFREILEKLQARSNQRRHP